MYREQKIASFQQGKDKLQLLKLTKQEPSKTQVYELYNCENGWKYKEANGEIHKIIYEEEIEKFAKVCQLTKKNENYYYLEEDKKVIYDYICYQVRLNRKRIKTTVNKDIAIKYFNARIYNLLFQTKLEL